MLFWTLYHLAARHELQRRVRKEIEEASSDLEFGDDSFGCETAVFYKGFTNIFSLHHMHLVEKDLERARGDLKWFDFFDVYQID